MTITTLHQVEESLRHVDHETLREMAYQTARSHISACGLTSRVGACAHIGEDETRDRIDALTDAQLAALLAPTAWMSIDIHSRNRHVGLRPGSSMSKFTSKQQFLDEIVKERQSSRSCSPRCPTIRNWSR